MRRRLSNRTLASLPGSIARPVYDRSAVAPGIVHLGVGAFHRAHQAVYVDECLAAGDNGWGIVGASLQSAATHEALTPQDGLYALAERHGQDETIRVIGSLSSVLVAPGNPPALLEILADPSIRIVTLTITEKAYLRDASGGLDAASQAIVADLRSPERPATAHGFLVEALRRRRAAGHPPFTILSCDNLPSNGVTLHRLLVAFAALRNPDLARHVEADVACPSSMVDRIVPATTGADRDRVSARLGLEDAWPVVTEPFRQWVIEDAFPSGRPDWERFGVTMVRDVKPFEEMKLRLLNGSHSAIAYIGLLAGHETVASAFSDPAIRRFVTALWEEAIPTLPAGAGLDPGAYVGELATRYANKALVHRTAQIANDGSQKLPQRIVGSALDRLRTGGSAGHLMLTVSAWIRALEERGRGLPKSHFSDPLDAQLDDIAAAGRPADETVAAIFRLTGFASGSPLRGELEQVASTHLETLRQRGVAAALAALPSGAQPS